MEEKNEAKGCNGHCELCSVNQRTYCAAQMAYYNQQEIAEVKIMLANLRHTDNEAVILMSKGRCGVDNDNDLDNEPDGDEDLDDSIKTR